MTDTEYRYVVTRKDRIPVPGAVAELGGSEAAALVSFS